MALAGQHDGALLAVEQLLVRLGMIERMRGCLLLMVEASLTHAKRWPLLELRRGPEVGVVVVFHHGSRMCLPHYSLLIRYNVMQMD